MQWISRYDYMPEIGEIVLVYDSNGYNGLNIAKFITGSGFVSTITNQTNIHVTHWCKLPNRPQ